MFGTTNKQRSSNLRMRRCLLHVEELESRCLLATSSLGSLLPLVPATTSGTAQQTAATAKPGTSHPATGPTAAGNAVAAIAGLPGLGTLAGTVFGTLFFTPSSGSSLSPPVVLSQVGPGELAASLTAQQAHAQTVLSTLPPPPPPPVEVIGGIEYSFQFQESGQGNPQNMPNTRPGGNSARAEDLRVPGSNSPSTTPVSLDDEIKDLEPLPDISVPPDDAAPSDWHRLSDVFFACVATQATLLGEEPLPFMTADETSMAVAVGALTAVFADDWSRQAPEERRARKRAVTLN
jgi:hypothetical protein